MAKDMTILVIQPALDRARIHMWREAEGLVAGLAAADTVGVVAFAVGVEVLLAVGLELPEPVHEGPGLGRVRMLARHHLRLRPVDAEDLRLAGFQLASKS